MKSPALVHRAALVLGILAIAVTSGAQSLGEVARREREKREKAQACPNSKTYSDADLTAASEERPEAPAVSLPGGSGPAETGADLAPPEAVEKPKSGKSLDPGAPRASGTKKPVEGPTSMGRTEAYWRARKASLDRAVDDARREVARVEGSG